MLHYFRKNRIGMLLRFRQRFVLQIFSDDLFHATVSLRAYTAGCCLLSGAVALKSLGETQEERILTNLKTEREREREKESE